MADPLTAGPEYCKACKAQRKSTEPCGGCIEPSVLPPNEPVLYVFNKMASQWNYSPTGERTGLNLPALKTVMSFYDIDDEPLLFERIQVCEKELLDIQREQNASK